jgi:UDP-N-acetylglucosamine--N-acetylmuramyl-(pentapeptide) pyrophosphoryl-undecaprenol N-acetylglucosamine transferase
LRKSKIKNLDLRLLITGGGTGGHLFPAIAVADEFRSRFPGSMVLFVGAGRAMDKKALSGRGYAAEVIHCGGLKGGSFLSRVKTLISLPIGFIESVRIIRRFSPDLVFGVGGYVTGPVVLAAGFLGITTCIHEQNSVPGMANRKLGRYVDRVFLSIPGSETYFAAKYSLVGNPIRKEFLALRNAQTTAMPETLDEKILTLTVIGGSLGAHQLNCLLPEALADVKRKQTFEFQVVHQTGAADKEMVAKAYREAGISARVEAFFDNMAEIINQADLLICRAGATTLAEITALRKPAILVPYPHAADDHQTKNGEFLVKGGAALMLCQKELNSQELSGHITDLCTNGKKREEMADKSGRLAQPEAAKRIVDECIQMIEAEQRISLHKPGKST